MSGKVFATSDLHLRYPDNREIVERMKPESPDDWLIVAGDVAERFDDIRWGLDLLARRFRQLIWVPGNHELWTHPSDPVTVRGVERYERLVECCRELGIHTPEDPFPIWPGPSGPIVIAPLFTLYDYTFRPDGTTTKAEALAYAHETGVVCTDEYLLHPDPYTSREDWCWARMDYSEQRLAECDPDIPKVLVNHWPLVREPTRVLRYPEFAQWCGTELTAEWHRKYRAEVVVYGHLHIPRTITCDDVPFTEVSLGYPREWRARKRPPVVPRQVLPWPAAG